MYQLVDDPEEPPAPPRAASGRGGSGSPPVRFQLVDDPGDHQPARGVGDQVLRQIGLTVRHGVQGLMAIPKLPGDLLGVVGRATGTPALERLASTPAIDGLLTRIGLPQPENATERVVGDAVSAMAGAGASNALGRSLQSTASPVAQGVGRQFAAQPGAQTLSAATGAGSAAMVREAGGGPIAQFIAGMGGGVGPYLTKELGSMALRGAARGGEPGRVRMEQRLQAFNDAGVEPTAGQAAGTRRMQALDSTLSKIPGSAGVYARRADDEAAAMGQRVGQIADALATNADPVAAGMAIRSGLQSFRDRFKETQGRLYGALDMFIGPRKPVDVSNTKQALATLNADIEGAPALSAWFKNNRIEGIEAALRSDTGGRPATSSPILRADGSPFSIPGTAATDRLPYEALKKLRALVGNEITDSGLSSDVPRSKWKALYGALTTDMEGAAKASGPQAEQAFTRANEHTRAGIARMEAHLDSIAGRDAVEHMYQATVGDAKNGPTRLAAVFRSLEPDERKVVQAAFIRRMGEALPGRQDAGGDVFSAETFLSNWNRLDPRAKQMMFAGQDGQLAKDLDAVARSAAMMREGSKVFANPSGTGQAIAAAGGAAGVGMALGTGHPGQAAMMLGGALGANLLSDRLLTNPQFVRWLTQTTTTSPARSPAAVGSLLNLTQQDTNPQGPRRRRAGGLLNLSGEE